MGGKATRLRPLSLNKPKCLFPLCNKPIIDYLLKNLAESGCTEVILAVNNLADKIRDYLGDEKYGIKLTYSYEDTPLGTGGAIKLAEKNLEDDFLVLNGDILSFINYQELVKNHKKNKITATITLKQVKDPTRYGVVRFGSNNLIKEFVEKPANNQAPSNWINAGCYALSQEIFDYIPRGKISLERKVFPILAEIEQLKGFMYNDQWIDIGVPNDYLRADAIIREGKASIHPTSIIEPNSVITNTIIWEHTKIQRNTKITDTIIGSDVIVGENTEIINSVIADNTTIAKNQIIIDEKIWPNLRTETSLNEAIKIAT